MKTFLNCLCIFGKKNSSTIVLFVVETSFVKGDPLSGRPIMKTINETKQNLYVNSRNIIKKQLNKKRGF